MIFCRFCCDEMYLERESAGKSEAMPFLRNLNRFFILHNCKSYNNSKYDKGWYLKSNNFNFSLWKLFLIFRNSLTIKLRQLLARASSFNGEIRWFFWFPGPTWSQWNYPWLWNHMSKFGRVLPWWNYISEKPEVQSGFPSNFVKWGLVKALRLDWVA